ncbi:MAG: hypothetical protein GVY33_09035 [Alphaproteobacteria bacterium]|jgi:predicted nucleic acid-binding protein|nr:hypothetical protein [Alphaproteobacteria bacterium]
MRGNRSPHIFLDTNIFKFAARKKKVRVPHRERVEWGEIVEDIDVYRPYVHNSIHRIRDKKQRMDALYIPMLAFSGIQGHAIFWTHNEVNIEMSGIPGMSNIHGLFYNCPINRLPSPEGERYRIIAGENKTLDEHTLDYLSNIEHKRYKEIAKFTGGFQGKSRKMNRNQALDAYHLWCAERSQMDYFVTMDYKLIKIIKNNKKANFQFEIVNPKILFEQIIKSIGIVRLVPFALRSFIFAMRRVGGKEFVEINDL